MKTKIVFNTLCLALTASIVLPIILLKTANAYGPNAVRVADPGSDVKAMPSGLGDHKASKDTARSRSSSGLRWQLIGPIGGESVLDIDVDPDNSLRLYATTQNGIYRSIDGGLSWSLILSGFFRELVINPQNSDVIYTGPHGPSGYGVYKSINGGDSWTYHNEEMTCDNLATMSIAASHPNILYTGSF